jgi:hypothetical protein
MKYHFKEALWVLTALFLALMSCNDPTVIGSDLLSGDELDIDFTDTLTLTGYSVEADSVRTYDPDIFTSDFENFHCGDFLDPIFGRTTSTIYAQVNLNTSVPNFLNGTLDSIVLILPYNADLSYGKLDETYSIEIYQLDESLNDSIAYYSTNSFDTKSERIGFKEFIPRVTDSVSVVIPNKDSLVTERQVPHLRINLDQIFSTAFFKADTSNFNTNSKFLEFFKGLQIRPVSSNSGMVSFKMRNAMTGLRVYYHEDSIFRQYQFPIFTGNVVTANFTHDYTGSIAEKFIGPDALVKDSLYFLQGLSGLNFDLEIPYAESFQNIVVNRAEIILPIITLPEDGMGYSPVKQILVSEVLTDSTFRVIEDASIALTRFGENFGDLFGGKVTTDGTYVLNISAHFQDMMRGLAGKKMRVSVYFKPERAARVVVAGARHGTTQAKLRLSFTNY